jgi:predicted NBD/HSP70 family sugar kinase
VDLRGWLRQLLETSRPRAAQRRLREQLAVDFGRGAAGLVNAVDPHLVTLGGLAGPLRDAAPEAFQHAFEAGLMSVHRRQPPEIVTGRAGDDAALIGIGLAAFDEVLNARQLALWASRSA